METVWVWEFLSKETGNVLLQDVFDEVDGVQDMKEIVAMCFSDFQWEEVQRRGINGAVVLVNRNGRYEDTGHWVFSWPQPLAKPVRPRRQHPAATWRGVA